MNHIEKLIEELCPNGVEFRQLGEIVRIKNGSDYKHLNPGTVPVYGSGGILTYVDEAAFTGETVLLPRKGSLSSVFFVNGPVWTVDTCYYTEIDEERLLPRFFYYVMVMSKLERLNTAGGVPSLTQRVLNRLKVPVPPLEVQREIVKVLDLFTDMEAELEAELVARRKQYEHYRDQLLTFPEDGGAPWVELGNLATVMSGNAFPKAFQNKSSGDFAFYKVSDMNLSGNSTFMGRANNYVNEEDVFTLGASLVPGMSIIFPKVGAAVATNKKRMTVEECLVDNNVMAVTPGQELNVRFLHHWFETIDLRDIAHQHVALPSIRKTAVLKMQMPLPPLSEQKRIAEILDTFDALVNDLESGLPAEIEARRKQYEYYRDKLLTFKQLEPAA